MLSIFQSNRTYWDLPKNWGVNAFVEMLVQQDKLFEMDLRYTNYPSLRRYSWGHEATPFAAALTIKRNAFFSHGSAMFIHGIGGSANEIFVNSEQSEKTR